MDEPATEIAMDGRGKTPSKRKPVLRARWWTFAGTAVVVAFIVSVMLSTRSSSVPVGASGPMSGMSMGTGRLALTMREIRGRTVRVPGGRAGVVVVVEARDCNPCVSATRAARAAVQRTAPGAQLIVVMVDPTITRGDVLAFSRSVGHSPASYVVDDRNGTLASMFDASGLGGVVVYDRLGRVVARPGSRERQIVAALRRTSQ